MKLKFLQTRSWSPIIPPLKKLKSLTDTFFITNTPSIDEAEEFDRHLLDHQYCLQWRNWRVWQTRSSSPILPPLRKLKSLTDTFLSPILPPLMKLKSLTDTFLITNTPSNKEAREFDRHFLDHQYCLYRRNWRVWQTRSSSPILPPLMKLKFWQTRSWSPIMIHWRNWRVWQTRSSSPIPSIDEAEEFDRHVLDHQYCLHWRNWRVWQTRSSSPILPPLMKLKSLTNTFLITNTASTEETEEFDRHVLDHQYSLRWRSCKIGQTRFDHQYSLHWRSWRVWQTRSSSPILPPLMKLKSLTDTFLITNTASTEETDEFDRHVRHHQYSLRWRSCKIWQTRFDHQYSLHWRSWRVWQTRSWSPILPPLMKLKSLTDTFMITNTASTEETEEFDRHVLHHQYSLHWWSWRVWQTRSWSPILPPLKKLKSLKTAHQHSLKEAEEFDTRSSSPILPPLMKLKFWQTRSWSPIIPPLKKLKSLTDTFFITNTPSIDEAEEFDSSWSPILPPVKKLKSLTDTFFITNTPSIDEAEEFDRHVLHHQYSLRWRSCKIGQTRFDHQYSLH